MPTRAAIIFTAAFLLVLMMLVVSQYIPSAVIFGLPVLLWFWFIGMIIFGAILAYGVRRRDG